MTGSPLSSLYHSVHSVYAPALLRNENGRQEVSGKVQVTCGMIWIAFLFSGLFMGHDPARG